MKKIIDVLTVQAPTVAVQAADVQDYDWLVWNRALVKVEYSWWDCDSYNFNGDYMQHIGLATYKTPLVIQRRSWMRVLDRGPSFEWPDGKSVHADWLVMSAEARALYEGDDGVLVGTDEVSIPTERILR